MIQVIEYKERLSKLQDDYTKCGVEIDSLNDQIISITDSIEEIRKESLYKNGLDEIFYEKVKNIKIRRKYKLEENVSLFTLLDETTFIVGYTNGVISIIDFINNKTVAVLNNHKGKITGLLKINDRLVTSSLGDNYISVWNLKTFTLNYTIKGNDIIYVITMIQFDNQSVITSNVNNSLSLWNIDKKTERKISSQLMYPIFSIEKLNDKQIATAGMNKRIKVWNIEEKDNNPITIYVNDDENLRRNIDWKLSITKLTDDIIAIGDFTGKLSLWNVFKKEMTKEIKNGDENSSIKKIIKYTNNIFISVNYYGIEFYTINEGQYISDYKFTNQSKIEDVIITSNKEIFILDSTKSITQIG